MASFAEYIEEDEDTMKMSEPLQALMRHMHSYASRYNVDVYRSLKENGGRQSKDGNGAMSKVKFTSVLLSAFARMNEMFKSHLLDELTTIYGTGPLEVGTVNEKKMLANAYAGRLTGAPAFDPTKAKVRRLETSACAHHHHTRLCCCTCALRAVACPPPSCPPAQPPAIAFLPLITTTCSTMRDAGPAHGSGLDPLRQRRRRGLHDLPAARSWQRAGQQ